MLPLKALGKTHTLLLSSFWQFPEILGVPWFIDDSLHGIHTEYQSLDPGYTKTQ